MNNVRITGERQREKRSVQRKWETDRHSLKGGEQEEDGGRRTEDGGRREDGMWRAARRGCDGGSFPSLFLTHTRIWIPSGTQTLPVPPLNGCPGEGRKGNRLKMEAGHSCNRFSHFPPSGGILHLFALPLPSLPPPSCVPLTNRQFVRLHSLRCGAVKVRRCQRLLLFGH